MQEIESSDKLQGIIIGYFSELGYGPLITVYENQNQFFIRYSTGVTEQSPLSIEDIIKYTTFILPSVRNLMIKENEYTIGFVTGDFFLGSDKEIRHKLEQRLKNEELSDLDVEWVLWFLGKDFSMV